MMILFVWRGKVRNNIEGNHKGHEGCEKGRDSRVRVMRNPCGVTRGAQARGALDGDRRRVRGAWVGLDDCRDVGMVWLPRGSFGRCLGRWYHEGWVLSMRQGWDISWEKTGAFAITVGHDG